MHEHEFYRQLIQRYLNNTATDQELEVFFALLEQGRLDPVLEDQLSVAYQQAMEEAVQENHKSRPRVRWLPFAAAAAILVVLVGAWMFFLTDTHPSTDDAQAGNDVRAEEIAPGGSRATLRLADGRTIDLSEVEQGIVVGDENITYVDGDTLLLTPSEMLVLTTPNGGTYQVTLSDGTKVWLNAASTLKYPSRFDEHDRIVELVGEGYFEIEKDTKRPFRVRSAGQEVDVLGTSFNISAYPDEADVRTTLVAGTVQIVNLQSRTVNRLKPGEQAVVAGEAMRIEKVDVEQYTAWKNGFFYFDRVPTQVAIAQLARWYDLDVIYEGEKPQANVYAYIDKRKPLGDVLKSFEESGLRFQVTQSGDRKQLIVLGD